MLRSAHILSIALVLAVGILLTRTNRTQEIAQLPFVEPKSIPSTRPEIKRALEALKLQKPRLPLPDDGSAAAVNNGRMRQRYIPEAWIGSFLASGRRNLGLEGTEDEKALYRLLTSCFWVVSRGNNCHYCLGHQELKLRSVGLPDDMVAALDCDWSQFDARTQAALTCARKLTLAPHQFGEEDLHALKARFSDTEIVDLIFSIARFNSTNRWTDSLGIPQDRTFHDKEAELLTPTSPQFEKSDSNCSPEVAVRLFGVRSLEMASREMILAGLGNARRRVSRIILEEPQSLGNGATQNSAISPPNWEKAMRQVRENGEGQAESLKTMFSDDHLNPKLKAQIAAVCAIQNHAWYSLGHAIHRLERAGGTLETILDPRDIQIPPWDRKVLQLAEKLTVTPHRISDADIAAIYESSTAEETAQAVYVICMSNFFDRFTEALGLTLEF